MPLPAANPEDGNATFTVPFDNSGARKFTVPPDSPPAVPPETSINAFAPTRISPARDGSMFS